MNTTENNSNANGQLEPAQMLTAFSETCHKVNRNTSIKECLAYLDALAQLKQALFAHDVFSHGEHVYREYMENLYDLTGCCSYYFKEDFLEKSEPDEARHYQLTRQLLEEHHQKDMTKWLEADLTTRVGYAPSSGEIDYLSKQARALLLDTGNADKAQFFLYRAVLLSLKRCQTSDDAKTLEENEKLLNTLVELASTYQISSDDAHALAILEYALMVSDKVFAAQHIPTTKPDGATSNMWSGSIKAGIPESHCRLRCLILRKRGHVQAELSRKENGPTREAILSSYQAALDFAEAAFGSESAQAEDARCDIARYRAGEGELEEVNVLLSQLKTAEQAQDLDSMESLHGLISDIYEEAGDFDQAILHFSKKVQILANMYGEDSDVAADYYCMLGELYERAGKNFEAAVCHQHSLTNYRAYLLRTQEEDADDPENTLANYRECLYNTGRMYRESGEYEKAVTHLKEALAIFDTGNDYSSVERANYMNALAQTYEKISFTDTALHYYLWAWDTYHTVAEFNKIRERNAALFESETEECETSEEQIRLHLTELGHGQVLQPFEQIDYPTLSKEEQNYFLERFGQLIRRRLSQEKLREQWIFLWKVYHVLCLKWQQQTGVEIPAPIKDALALLQHYLNGKVQEENLISFGEQFFAYLAELEQAYRDTNDDDSDDDDDFDDDDFDDDDDDFDDDDSDDDSDDDEDDSDDDDRIYLPFYYALANFFHSIAESDVDFYSLQNLICVHLPAYAEFFTTAYCKETKYTDYELQLRYRQVISSPVFAEWIDAIQKQIQ